MSAVLLEVIVTSAREAVEAQAGGADRLELVRALECGGLTPPLELVREVIEHASVPVRVMLRESESMLAGGPREVETLRRIAADLSQLPIEGLVTGFLHAGAVDRATLEAVLEAAPNRAVTFHRAFDEAVDPRTAVAVLRQYGQIDRVLTNGGAGIWGVRRQRVADWGSALGDNRRVIFAVGKDPIERGRLVQLPANCEVHVGRAARVPQTPTGAVDRRKVAALKRTLLSG